MTLFQHLFLLSLVLSAAITAGIVSYALQRRRAPGAKAVIVLMAAITWWTAIYFVIMTWYLQPTSSTLLLFKIMYLGILVAPPAFLVFTFAFVGLEHWIRPSFLVLLAIEPAATAILIWIDPLRGPFANLFNVQLGDNLAFGPGFQINSLYSYGLITVGDVLLGARALTAPLFYRKQAVLLFAGSLAVVGSNVVSVTWLLPIYHLDVTVFGFMVMGLLMAYALRGQGLLELLPVARHAVVEAMQDGVLVVDNQDRVVDINPAADRMLCQGPEIKPGQSALAVFSEWRELIGPDRGRETFSREIQLDLPGVEHVDARITRLLDRHNIPSGWIVVLRDITQVKTIENRLRIQLENNKMLQEKLQEQAVRDVLTGLYNRRYLEEALHQEIQRAEREQSSLVVCILDIDHFKQINDAHGHGAGDSVLKKLADVLTQHIRGSDVACRYGGEEFVIVMPRTPLLMGLQRIDALRNAFGALTTEADDDEPIRASFSAGVAAFPIHGTTIDLVLATADRALYDAKAAGRNRVLAAELLERRLQS